MAALAAALLVAAQPGSAAVPAQRHFDRVLIIVLENQDYGDAVRDAYLESLGKRGALLTGYHGLSHPSYNNYLGLVAGRVFDMEGDEQQTLDGPTVADLLEARGLRWKAYAEGFPGHCFTGAFKGRYARKHMPFLSFRAIQANPARCARIVNASQFRRDRANPPDYALYVPDQYDDGHDTGLAYASSWLKGFLEPLLADPAYMKGTLVAVTFDESRTGLFNHIYTVLLGAMVRPGSRNDRRLDHFSLLRTIEMNFGLGAMAEGDREATPIEEVWIGR